MATATTIRAGRQPRTAADRRPHGGAGCEPVVDDDGGPPSERQDRSQPPNEAKISQRQLFFSNLLIRNARNWSPWSHFGGQQWWFP